MYVLALSSFCLWISYFFSVCVLFSFYFLIVLLFCFFFFQAEDGIRDWSVTGVQTCALPISPPEPHHRADHNEQRAADQSDPDNAPYRGGRDRNTEGLRCRFTTRVGAHGGDIIAGHGLGGRRHEGLYLLGFVGGDAIDGLRLEAHLPARGSRPRQLNLLRRRGTRIAQDDRDGRLLTRGSLGAEDAFPPGNIDLGLTCDVESKVRCRGRVIGRYFRDHLILARRNGIRGSHLELDVLRLAWIERKGIELLTAVLLGVSGIEVLRRLRRQAHQHFLRAVVLDPKLELETRLRRAAQFGELWVERQLGGQISRELHLDGQAWACLRGGPARDHGQIRGADRGVLGHVQA